MTVPLPFGRTKLSAREFESVVDREGAVAQAKKGNVREPEERIQQLIDAVPQLLSWLDDSGRTIHGEKQRTRWRCIWQRADLDSGISAARVALWYVSTTQPPSSWPVASATFSPTLIS
ncbi:hypothetical protein Har1129_05505 [Haloarcula sp. CBA1129]|nr:hypothetical protein Har1129_05505 [Haloarcula sp. CBA1129]